MLDEIHVQDIALIRDATLVPARGLTVVTGETGAGKTALVSAFKLLAGERADSSLVREGAKELVVEGRFFVQGSASAGKTAAGTAAGTASEDTVEEHVVRRSVGADGRGRVHIDGAMAAVAQLSEGVGTTLDLCGQHEHQRLMKPVNHRSILDAWIGPGLDSAYAAYRACFYAARDAVCALDGVAAAGQLDAASVEQARFVVRSIDEVAPSQEEYDELAAAVVRLEHAESLLAAYAGAHDALAGEGGALDAAARAAALLDSAASYDESAAAKADSLRSATYIVEDIARDVRSARDALDVDASSLAAMQDRLGAMQHLMRTWGPTIADVLDARAKALETLAALDSIDDALAEAQARVDATEAALRESADALSAVRTQAAPQFADQVCAQMARLDLGTAAVECVVERLDRTQWSPVGADRVEFLFRPGADNAPRPLAKIASGGEISRVMLAIKVVLGERDIADTLVFDEVDAGVGGAAARSLAQVLADLARTHQVVVVTHLPQVAVMAQVHYVATKTDGTAPETVFAKVQGQERIDEVARMLSGDVGDVARSHAQQMLLDAQKAQ